MPTNAATHAQFRWLWFWFTLLALGLLPTRGAQGQPQASPRAQIADMPERQVPPSPAVTKPPQAPTQPHFGDRSLTFVPNMGQMNPAVSFVVDTSDGAVFFTAQGFVLALPIPQAQPSGAATPGSDRLGDTEASVPTAPAAPPTIARLRFDGAASAPQIVGTAPLSATFNYFIGDDPARWHTNIPSYAGIVYKQLYPGIDLRYDGAGGQMKGTYLVAPGADPSRIRWRYDGASSLHVDPATGNLLMALPASAAPAAPQAAPANGTAPATARVITEQTPVAWQEIEGRRVPVSSRFAVAADGSVSFALSDYDHAQPLTLDPTIVWSTYMGGSSNDSINGVATDNAGNVFVSGASDSNDVPQSIFWDSPPYDQSPNGSFDAFISKFDKNGRLLFTTYIGSGAVDAATSIAVNGGTVSITGYTYATSTGKSSGGADGITEPSVIITLYTFGLKSPVFGEIQLRLNSDLAFQCGC